MVSTTPHVHDTAPADSPGAGVTDHAPAVAGRSARLAHPYLEGAPLASAVVAGPAHPLVFANARFRALGDGVGVRAEVGAPVVDALPSTVREPLNQVLDRVRRDGIAVRSADLG